MTQFSSITIPPAQCGADDCTGCQSAQRNPPNPILVDFRSDPDLSYTLSELDPENIGNPDWETWPVIWYASDDERYHARAVLTRLAALEDRSLNMTIPDSILTANAAQSEHYAAVAKRNGTAHPDAYPDEEDERTAIIQKGLD